jgi:ABC-type branched-subunit amino acid transport system substrate-binding protein
MFPLTGAYGAYAEEMKRGVEIAAEEFDAQGGILGKMTFREIDAEIISHRRANKQDKKILGATPCGN